MISRVVHLYLDERDTYIRVFWATATPHLLSVHVPDQLVVEEICYQTILQGYNSTLIKDKKRASMPYGFHVGFYMVKDTTQDKQEGLSQIEFRFQTCRFWKNDSKGMVLKHASQVLSCWSYAHDKFEDEIFIENAQYWDEVVARMVNPKMTRFKSMRMDEQLATIEKLSQEALRSREEMIAEEATEVPLVAPVQDRGFPMTHDTHERWFIMIEQAQRVIVQLQAEPYLIGMMGSPTGNPDEIQAGPSNPKQLYIGEIVGLDDPEIPTPQARSLGDVLVQSETVGKSGRESDPNPLHELINIYDGEESLEVSLVTPVPIMEEKKPEKESTPAPDAQIHVLP
jgi:hypothetical protein